MYTTILTAGLAGVSSCFFQAEDGIRDYKVTGVQTCALPISSISRCAPGSASKGWKIESLRPSNSSGLTRNLVHSARLKAGVAFTQRPSRYRDRKSVV